MALGSHLITVRRLEKYINDVIGKKANLPDTSKTIVGNISQINSDLTPSSTKQISTTYSDQYFESCCNKVGKLVVCSVMTKCSNTIDNTTVLYGRLPYVVKELLEFGWVPLAQNASFSATSYVNSNSKDIYLQISGIYHANTYMRANFVYVTNE